MSLAYKCDLCGDFVSSESDADSERILIQDDITISNTDTTMTITLDLGKPHVCDTCFAEGKAEAIEVLTESEET